MRGTPFPHLRFVVPVGIIPAHAGNTSAHCRMRISGRDHPRACGEHVSARRRPRRRRGSSPRMRGTLGLAPVLPSILGIIPAHAGNTRRPIVRPTWCRDHPRACGEHSVMAALTSRLRGSSPRMRGTRYERVRFVAELGIIPAHAGNTNSQNATDISRRDHPRACGEHCRALRYDNR